MNCWYVIQTKPKKEEDVWHQLSRAHFELFFPKIRGLMATKPLFPSYLFIRIDLEDPRTYRLVRFTRNVKHLLGDTGGPLPLAEEIIETLRERTTHGILEQELLFREGDQVRIKKGILKDLIGMIEKNIPEAGRVKILFKWMGSRMRAVLKYRDLEKAA